MGGNILGASEIVSVMVVFQKGREKKMTYMVLRLVREWGIENLRVNKNLGQEYQAAISELVTAITKVMKFL